MARLLLLIVLALPSVASAESVVVFPLDARGVAYGTAADATELIMETMRSMSDVAVVEPKTVEEQIGVNLTEQARACDYDVFCLVEVGEVLEGDLMLIGHVRLLSQKDGEKHELKLIVLDVAKATITEVLIWKIPLSFEDGLSHATRAATRKLFSAPDGLIKLVVYPDEARVFFYGDQVQRPSDGGAVPYWSGVYYATAEAKGHQTSVLRIEVPRSRSGAPAPIEIELQPDLLYVDDNRQKDTKVFGNERRRTGSGVGADTAGAVTDGGGSDLVLAAPWPWITAGTGIVLTVVGGVLMGNAQGDYNALSGQERYMPGKTVTAEVAIDRREDARMKYRAGSGLTLAGAGVLIASVVWVIVDYVITTGGSK